MRHPALILPLLLAIPGAVIAKLTASPPSPEAGKVSLGAAVVQAPDDSTERPAAATLRRAFECQSLDKAIDAALAANGIALDGSPSKLATSIRVFGLSTSTVAVFRDGGEDMYTAYFDEIPLARVAIAAGIHVTADGVLDRSAANGKLSLWQEDSSVALRCTVSFD